VKLAALACSPISSWLPILLKNIVRRSAAAARWLCATWLGACSGARVAGQQ
jgi:hypothetical protein